MATVTHLHDVNDTVWLLDAATGIKKCTILEVNIDKDLASTEIKYRVVLVVSNKQQSVVESEIYALLSGVGSALEAYEAILLA